MPSEGMPSGASPSFGFQVSLDYLGVPWASSSLVSCHSLFYNPSKDFTQNLKTSQHKTQQKSRELRQYKKINHHFWYCCELIIISYWCNIYCIPTYLWFIPSDTTHRFNKISKQHIENRICQKQNSLQQSEHSPYLWYPKNSIKIRKNKKFVQKDSAERIRTV